MSKYIVGATGGKPSRRTQSARDARKNVKVPVGVDARTLADGAPADAPKAPTGQYKTIESVKVEKARLVKEKKDKADWKEKAKDLGKDKDKGK